MIGRSSSQCPRLPRPLILLPMAPWPRNEWLAIGGQERPKKRPAAQASKRVTLLHVFGVGPGLILVRPGPR